MATFEQVKQMLFGVLPVADVSRIVCDYAERHRTEWIKKSVKDICAQINATARIQPIFYGKRYFVSRFVRQSMKQSIHKIFQQRAIVFNSLNRTGQRCRNPIDRLINYGILKKKSTPKCDHCGKKNIQLTLVHRIGQKSKLMCVQCDTEKIYTPGYATGFRALPNRIQQFIVEGLNDRISLLTICHTMHARGIDIGVSYATIFRWMMRDDMR